MNSNLFSETETGKKKKKEDYFPHLGGERRIGKLSEQVYSMLNLVINFLLGKEVSPNYCVNGGGV